MGVLLLNFFLCSFVADTVSITIPMLMNEDYFGIPQDKIAVVANDIQFYSVPTQMVMGIFAGYCYDVVGRRVTIFMSLIFCAVTAILTPHSPSIYPWVLVSKIVLTMCTQPLF